MELSIFIPILILYLVIMSCLAYYGYHKTVTEADYLIAGGNINPVVMALSYGATFISTSSLIGFGGTSATFGFGLLWLSALNIIFGVFAAFAIYGTRIRSRAKQLNVFTFPSLLGGMYKSRFVTIFAGTMIFIFMPAYTSIVLIGGGRFIQETMGINYNLGLLLIAAIVTVYVLSGGLRAVMYTDAFAAVIMVVMASVLLFVTYQQAGGVIDGHRALSSMENLVPSALVEQGHQGWTSMPAIGSPQWWTLVSTLIMGVGIGVLAQPQLAMRSMTVSSDRSLYRSIAVGGVVIFFLAGGAYMVGPLSNIIFQDIEGVLAMEAAGGNTDLVIPILINEIMPDWFIYLFTLTAISAALSTVSSLIHVQAASLSEDILKKLNITAVFNGKISMSRLGVLIGMTAAISLAYVLPGGVIAQATAFWFGICAAVFLPALTGGLFWKKASKAGAEASIVVGFLASTSGFLFFHAKEASAIGLSEAVFGKTTLLPFPMTHIDPLFYAFPLSALTFIVVSLITSEKKAGKVDMEGKVEQVEANQ
ncbi:sodium:solute symporter family protein [Salibacterium qingdaonense]|uniref:Solute:Na+ symporter, SSS family n=1 Tax=Salibacterium qingdaonense TaxID=266892 RepID=A0A1I4HZ15_9BACI|nr:sodium:solute symporter family protein [Salibacterium qingdaonense]SFL47369.1 solute:Na+ symporter, SSS family [Salibacterium qingdaonense]